MILEKCLEGYENRKLVDISSKEMVEFKDLGKMEHLGVLKANIQKDGKLFQVYTEKDNHVGVVASTRVGKTTGYVIPTILSFASQKVPKSMFIADPKCEVYNKTASYLKAKGYKVRLINYMDYRHSDSWNPMTEIYRKYLEAYSLGDDIRYIRNKGKISYEFNGKIYDDISEMNKDLQNMRRILMEDVNSKIMTLANIMIINDNRDQYWQSAARQVFAGFIWGLLEDTHPTAGRTKITEDTFSINTIISIASTFSFSSVVNDGGFFSTRSKDSRAFALVNGALFSNAKDTRACVMSIFNSSLIVYMETSTKITTCSSSFDLSELVGNEPIALFVSFKDEIEDHFVIVKNLVSCVYTFLLDNTRKVASKKLSRPFYFILDEFGNFPMIENMKTLISSSGSRDIWFILILQSYAQLRNVYGSDIAEIIRDNLNVKIFMGSNEAQTLEEFSKSCGMRTRVSPLSALNGAGKDITTYSIETIPLVPVSKLASLGKGECMITEIQGDVTRSRFDPYYICPDFNEIEYMDEHDYKCSINLIDSKYFFNNY